MEKSSLILLLFVTLFTEAQHKNYASIAAGETENNIIRIAANVVPSSRQLRWQQLELTAFFHFGINTFTNSEWGTGKEDPRIFNPTSLDAGQWVRTVKEAGFKQVILTAKHHDGFCLWPSKYTEHSVKNSPWKNGKGDVVREVAEACKRYHIGFGIYLSPWDRNCPLYGTEAYNDYFIGQLTELLTQYGRIDEVWFDGANGEGPNGKKQVYDFERWYRLIRKLQPAAVIAIMGPDVRWVGTESGYGRQTEWSVVPVGNLNPELTASVSQQHISFTPAGDMTGDDLGSRNKILHAAGLVWYPAETDVSIRPGWFYHPEENEKLKSAGELMDIYLHSVGRNSVLLLNIPPDKKGLIHDCDVRVLREWKAMRDAVFGKNLLAGAVISSANGFGLKSITDNDYNTYWTTRGQDTTSVIDLVLDKKATFNLVMLQENISMGQRIEKFELTWWDGSRWIKAADGTTVGYKRLLTFPHITARKIRLRIVSSRLNPTIAEMGLYLQPVLNKE